MENSFENRVIAVDFDGTIVEHKYPAIGKEIPFATYTLKKLQKKGFRLVLWTYRAGKPLDDAVEWCKNHGIEFYAVNSNYPEEVFDDTISRKIDADIFIDDRNIGGLKEWGEIYALLCGEENFKLKKSMGKGVLSRLFNR